MERLKAPPDMTGAKVVYTERQGRLRYTYYDNNVVKITRYKRKSRIRWNRVIIALIVLVLAAYAVAHLIGFVASAVAGKKKESSGKEFVFESSAAETAAPVQTTAPPETAPAVTESVPDADTSSAAEEPEVKRLDFKVCIDPGHGDYDVGVMNADGVTESTVNLEFAMLVKEQLEALGAEVVMTRTTDMNVSLDERCSLANDTGCDLFISLHRSGSPDPYSGSMGVAVMINNASPPMDKRLADNILEALKAVGITQDLGVQPGFAGMPESNYQINTNTVMPSCQVELGYLTSAEDTQLYEEKKQQYAAAIAEAAARTARELGVIATDGKRILTGPLLSEGKSHIIVSENAPIGNV